MSRVVCSVGRIALPVVILLAARPDALASPKTQTRAPAKTSAKAPASAKSQAKARPQPAAVNRRTPPPGPQALTRMQQGAAAFQAGDYEAAVKLLRPLAGGGDRLQNQDYALYFLAESEALLGAESSGAESRALLEAAAGHFQSLLRLTQSRFATLAQARLADCAHALGGARDAAARTAYQTLLRAPGAELDGAVMRAHLAQILGRTGQPALASTEWRKLYIEHPWHPLAEHALLALQRTGQAAKVEASEHLQRARALSSSRRWEDAIAELSLIPPDINQALKDEVDYWTGTTYYKMRRSYDVAATKLLGVAVRFRGERQAEALFHGARALSRADQDELAIARYLEVVRTHPGSRYSAEASFLSGWLEYNRGQYRAAIERLGETVRRFPGKFGEDARWYQALSHYLLREDAAALQLFQQIGRRDGTAGDRGRYFAARTLQRLGHHAEAQGVYRALVMERPLSYYALLSRARLREAKLDAGPFGDPARAPVIPLLQKDERLSQDPKNPEFLRVDELLQVGLPVEAGFELRRAEGPLLRRLGSAQALPLLFDRYERGENFQRPYYLAEEYGARALQQDPHKSAAARLYWERVFPLAYKKHIERYAPSGENPPRYLYTIMQKESAYNPHDVSYADAIGLLQMIPPTSRLVARHVGRPYTDDVLYDPEGNIAFGSWYIGHLLRKFKGQIALGAGSFNAGPRAMVKWLKARGELPLDEFIELCPYTQTREYMKKVLDIYAHYVYLWDRQEYLPDLRIDKDYLQDDGVDY